MAIISLINIVETKADTANKQSWISVTISVSGGSGTISGGAVSLRDPTTTTYTEIGTMNGVTVPADTNTTVFSWSGVVPWASTGGGTVYVKYAAYTLGGSSVSAATKSYTLVTLPVPTTITFGTITAGTATTFTIQRASTSYRTTITATVGGTDYAILTNSTSTSTNYTFPLSIFEWHESNNSLPGTITVTTLANGNVIGGRSYKINILCPATPPELTNVRFDYDYEINPPGQSYVNAETLTGKFYNNGLTKVRIRFTATPTAYGKIMLVTASGDYGDHVLYDGRPGSAPPLAPGAYNEDIYIRNLYGKTGLNVETITVTDWRGNQATTQTQVDLYVASAPTLANATLTRGTYSGGSFTENEEGTAIRWTATLSSETTFGILSFYKDGTFITESQYASGTVTYYFTGVDPTVNTELRVDVHNWLSQGSYSYIAPLTMPDFNYNPTLHSIAIGKQASRQNAFECDKDEWLSGGFHISGNIAFDEVKQTGERYIRFGNDASNTNHHDIQLIGGNPNSVYGFQFYDRVNSARVMGYNTSTQYLSFIKDATLTLTYATNSYVSSTSFANVQAYRRSNLYIIRANLEVTTAILNNTNWVKIGTISNYSCPYVEYLNVPAQNGSGVLAVRITTDGEIGIANTCGSSVSGLCRFSSTTVCS